MRNIIIAAIVAAIIVCIIKAILRNPSTRGALGEKRVSGILNSLPAAYLSIDNVIVPSRQSTSQIDHVVVSPYGIFVIETKNYSGRIYGSESSDNWKETFKTTKGNFFRSPIKQNWGHIYALSEYLNLDKRIFKSIIVFSDKATLKVEASTPVIHMSQLKDEILRYRQEIIPGSKVESIFNQIQKTNLVGTEAGNKHVENVKKGLTEWDEAVRQGKCPRCGSALVRRSGKYGSFYGCSDYPKCKFTQKL